MYYIISIYSFRARSFWYDVYYSFLLWNVIVISLKSNFQKKSKRWLKKASRIRINIVFPYPFGAVMMVRSLSGSKRMEWSKRPNGPITTSEDICYEFVRCPIFQSPNMHGILAAIWLTCSTDALHPSCPPANQLQVLKSIRPKGAHNFVER